MYSCSIKNSIYAITQFQAAQSKWHSSFHSITCSLSRQMNMSMTHTHEITFNTYSLESQAVYKSNRNTHNIFIYIPLSLTHSKISQKRRRQPHYFPVEFVLMHTMSQRESKL